MTFVSKKPVMRLTLIVTLGALLAACGPLVRDVVPESVGAQLAGENQVPPVATEATGEVTASLLGNVLTVTGTFGNLMSDLFPIEGTPAHIHIGAPGEAGPVVFNLEVVNPDARSGTVGGVLTLSAEQVQEFRDGLYYVNIHTVDHPAGELRGQLAANTPEFAPVVESFDATLLPENEVHDVTSDATGSAFAVLRQGDRLTISGSFGDLTSALHNVGDRGPAHVHIGFAGEAGDVEFALDVDADEGDTAGRFGFTGVLAEAQIERLRTGGYYVNVHTANFQQGEVRGQVFPTNATAEAQLTGEQEAHEVDTTATGSATATMEGFTLSVTGSFEGLGSDLFDVADVGPAHVHVAPRGENGPVVFPLVVDAAAGLRSGTFSLEEELTEAQRADFLRGRYYVNIHTDLYGAGELRGQLEPFDGADE
jgi:hypothetical protein